MPPHNHDGTGGMHMYIPWWKYDRKNDFPRGYHIEIGGGRDMPGAGMFDDVCEEFEGYGADLKRTCRKRYGTGDWLCRPRRDGSESRYLLRN